MSWCFLIACRATAAQYGVRLRWNTAFAGSVKTMGLPRDLRLVDFRQCNGGPDSAFAYPSVAAKHSATCEESAIFLGRSLRTGANCRSVPSFSSSFVSSFVRLHSAPWRRGARYVCIRSESLRLPRTLTTCSSGPLGDVIVFSASHSANGRSTRRWAA